MGKALANLHHLLVGQASNAVASTLRLRHRRFCGDYVLLISVARLFVLEGPRGLKLSKGQQPLVLPQEVRPRLQAHFANQRLHLGKDVLQGARSS